MEPLLRYRAMEAFCRQHAKMDGESASFWLAEADAWKSRRLEESLEALSSQSLATQGLFERLGGRATFQF
jgi:hypothetical protein